MSLSTSVVIRAYNEGHHLGRLFEGLRAQTVQPDQIILVDSGSTDDTVPIAKENGVNELVHIAKEEFSFGRSLNMGCEVATGELLLIPSAHVYPVYDTWLEKLIAPFADPLVGVSYGRQVGDHRTKFAERSIMNRWFPPVSIPRQDHPFSNNANAAVRRELWQLEPYDEGLTGLEDLDFARRIMDRGYYVSYVAEAPVVHVHEEDWSQVVNRYRREAIAHKRIFNDQEMSAPEAALLWARSVASDYSRALRDGGRSRDILEVPKFRAAQFLGTYEGFRQSGPVTRSLKERFYYPDRIGRRAELPAAPGRAIQYSAPADH